jgi:hypothetical protein
LWIHLYLNHMTWWPYEYLSSTLWSYINIMRSLNLFWFDPVYDRVDKWNYEPRSAFNHKKKTPFTHIYKPFCFQHSFNLKIRKIFTYLAFSYLIQFTPLPTPLHFTFALQLVSFILPPSTNKCTCGFSKTYYQVERNCIRKMQINISLLLNSFTSKELSACKN